MASYSDDFNRASLGANWAAVNGGTWDINASVRARQDQATGTYRALRYVSALDGADVDVTVVCRVSAAYIGAGVLVRMPGSGTAAADIDGYAIIGFGTDAIYLLRFDSSDDGGVGYSYAYSGMSLNTDYTLRITVQGSTVTGYVNGTQRFQFTDTTYAGGVGQRSVALLSYGRTPEWDSFAAADIVSAQTIAPAGVASGEAFGTTVVSTAAAGQSVLPGGVASAETFGGAALAVDQAVTPAGIPFGEYALRFYGNGANQIDRVRIALEDGVSTQYPPNVGAGSFTVEMWVRCAYADNASEVTDVRYSNPLYDRDSWGEQRGHVIGVTRRSGVLVACFGQAGAGLGWATIRGTADIGDGNWHHVAVTRNAGTGAVVIWVDGVQDASGTYDTSDWSYPAGHVVVDGQDNEYAVLGTEKHDVGVGFNGSIASLRISNSVRYAAGFAPAWRWAPDANAVGLYLFDDGVGTVAADSATVSGAPTDGELLVGGSPVGPVWSGLPFGNVGDATVAPGGLAVAPAGVGSAEGFGGAAVLPGAVTVAPDGIGSGFVSDSQVLLPGAVAILAAGIGAAEGFGAVVLAAGAVTLAPAGVATAEGFGDAVVLPGAVAVQPVGVATAEAVGDAVVLPGAATVQPAGVASDEAVGDTVVLSGGVTIAATGIVSAEAVGDALVNAGGTVVQAAGIDSAEGFGLATMALGGVVVLAAGVASAEGFGAALVAAGGTVVLAAGVGSAEGFGLAAVAAGAATVLPASVASAEAFGDAVVLPGAVGVLAEGVGTGEVFGAALLALGGATVAPAGVESAEAFGGALVAPGTVTIAPAGVASGEAVGVVLIVGQGLPQFVTAAGIGSGEAFGVALLLLQLVASRTLRIEREGRTVSVMQESRTVVAGSESRTIVIRGG